MFLSKAILIALTLMGFVNAAVLNTSSERRATQSCHATDHGVFASYSIRIGVPYGGPDECDDTYNNLEDEVGEVTSWQCVEDNGNIQLWFDVPTGNGDGINVVLGSLYPSVNSFNCPDD